MSLAELLPALQSLPRNEKVEAIRFLVSGLTRQEGTDCLAKGDRLRG